MRKLRMVGQVEFFVADFMEAEPPESEMLIYCDPPYTGTTGYGVGFDTAAFWDRCFELEDAGHVVIVSEYRAPEGVTLLREIATKTDLKNRDGEREDRTERLFRPGEHRTWRLI
jgi:DNA adenine methylase